MALVETQDVTKPAGSRDRSLGDDDIREFKRSEAERGNVDHIRPADETGENNVGHHRTIVMADIEGSNPSSETDILKIFIKDVNGKAELHAIDEDGNVMQLTNAGKLAVLGSEGFRTGDLLLSASTDTPTGWTDVSTTYDNKFIRIGDDTPLTTTGGSDTHDHGGATESHVLTVAEMPAHTHTMDCYKDNATKQTRMSGYDTDNYQGVVATNSTGGDGGHTHNLSSASNVPAYIQTRMYKKD